MLVISTEFSCSKRPNHRKIVMTLIQFDHLFINIRKFRYEFSGATFLYEVIHPLENVKRKEERAFVRSIAFSELIS